jgi:membrane-associated protease RseP (regulator of RpoE activity)
MVLAFALFQTCNAIWGQYPDEPTLIVAAVTDCVPSGSDASVCLPTPAAKAGVQPQDRLTGLNGQPLASYGEYRQAMAALASTGPDGQLQAGPMTLTVDRPGQGEITLAKVDGLIAPFDDGSVRPFLGVSLRDERVKVGPIGTVKDMAQMAVVSVQAIAKLPYYAWITVRDLVTSQPRGPDSVMSVVGAARVAGEVAANPQLDASSKMATYLRLLGSINLFVALLNLVPLLPFDGGHVVAGLYGVLRSAWARWRGRPDPGPVDAAKLQPVAYIVVAFLILFGAVLIVADIISPIQLF